MTMAKINCPKCLGTGLTGTVAPLVVCTECNGSGIITVDDTTTLASINAASQVPIEEQTASELTTGEIADLVEPT